MVARRVLMHSTMRTPSLLPFAILSALGCSAGASSEQVDVTSSQLAREGDPRPAPTSPPPGPAPSASTVADPPPANVVLYTAAPPDAPVAVVTPLGYLGIFLAQDQTNGSHPVTERASLLGVRQPTVSLGGPGPFVGHADAFTAAWGPVYLATVGSDDHLYLRVRSAAGVWGAWSNVAAPPSAATLGQRFFTGNAKVSLTPYGSLEISLTGADGHLWVAQDNGVNPNGNTTGWRWLDGGTPPGTTLRGDPSPTWLASNYRAQFALGENRHILAKVQSGTWFWRDHGGVPGASAAAPPEFSPNVNSPFVAGTVRTTAGTVTILESELNGTTRWLDQGAPPGMFVNRVSKPLVDATGTRRFVAIVSPTAGGASHVFEHRERAGTSTWIDHGAPATSPIEVSFVARLDGGFNAYVSTYDAHLYELAILKDPTFTTPGTWADLGGAP